MLSILALKRLDGNAPGVTEVSWCGVVFQDPKGTTHKCGKFSGKYTRKSKKHEKVYPLINSCPPKGKTMYHRALSHPPLLQVEILFLAQTLRSVLLIIGKDKAQNAPSYRSDSVSYLSGPTKACIFARIAEIILLTSSKPTEVC